MIIIYSAVIGLLFGSFISNTVWQIRLSETRPKSKKLKSSKRSVCGHCGHELRVKDLVPIFSWVRLGGRCRYCKKKLSIQYPIVELLVSVLFAWSALAWQFDTALSYGRYGIWLLILTSLIALAIYDLHWYELPNRLTSAFLGLTLIYILLASIEPNLSLSLGGRFWAALGGGGFFYLLHIAGRGKWMGGGDVKLVFVMGLLLGGQSLLVALFLGFLIAAVVSVFLMLGRRLGRKDLIPFGPFLIAATFIAMLYGQAVMNSYIDLLTY